MRILIATPLYPPDIGGPATYAKILEEELPKRDVSATLVTFGSVRHLPKLFRHLVYFWKVFLHAKDTDVVLALDPFSVGAPALAAAKLRGVPFIAKIVGDYAWEQGVQRYGVTDAPDIFSLRNDYPSFVRFLKWVERTVAFFADATIVPSAYLKKIVSQWGIQEEKISVIANSVEIPRLSKLKEDIRKELGWENKKVILSAGRLVPWKGFPKLIEAYKELLSRIPEAILCIAGSGPEEYVIREAIEKQGVGGKATLVGQLSHDDLLLHIRAADIFALNTRYEGLSHVLLEAMSVETPVVTTPVGGNSDLIEDGVTGIFAHYNDAASFTSSLEKLLMDDTMAEKIRKNAREKAAAFTKEKMISGLLALVASVAGKNL